MTDEQKAALEWLVSLEGSDLSAITRHVRTLQAMLAEPRLPKEPERAALVAMAEDGPSMETRYRALYAHLTKPATKKIWHIVFCNKDDGGSYLKDGYVSQGAAIHDAAHFLKEGHAVCVELIEVPT